MFFLINNTQHPRQSLTEQVRLVVENCLWSWVHQVYSLLETTAVKHALIRSSEHDKKTLLFRNC